jgi:hypothetical protein
MNCVRAFCRLIISDKPLAIPTVQIQVVRRAAQCRLCSQNPLKSSAKLRVENAIDYRVECRVGVTFYRNETKPMNGIIEKQISGIAYPATIKS